MSDYDNTNRGALFKNDKGDNASRPDYKGKLNVDGTDYWISAWLKVSKGGEKFMSLSVQEQDGARIATVQQGKRNDPDDDIPF